MKTLVWLASYPKSGNTWTRIFLANYFNDRETPLPINEIGSFGANDTSIGYYRDALKKRFREEDHRGHLAIRGKVLGKIGRNGADLNFLKSHNMNARIFGVDLVPPQLTASAVHIVRNPLDVVLSYARHYGYSADEAIRSLANPNNSTVSNDRNVKSYLGTWSQHALSWAGAQGFPVLLQRYEDMMRDPHATFARLLEHLGVPVDADRLDRAIRFSAFDEMKSQEAKIGFAERSRSSDRFFHTGETGQWKSGLTPAQVAQIRKDHGPVMTRFGYF